MDSGGDFRSKCVGRLWEFNRAKGEGLGLKREDVIFFWGGRGFERCMFDNLCTVLYQNCLSIPKNDLDS